MHPGRQNDRRGGTEEHDGDEGLTTGLLGRLAGRMAALAASSSSHSLVECVGLRPCEDGPRLAEPRATSPVVSPNRWMAGLYAPFRRRSPPTSSTWWASCPPSSRAATCATDRTRSARPTPPPTTGSPSPPRRTAAASPTWAP